MDKQTLIRDIKASNDGAGLLNVKQVAKYMNMHCNTVTKFLKGLEYLPSGRDKRYAVSDVAQRIMERRTLS